MTEVAVEGALGVLGGLLVLAVLGSALGALVEALLAGAPARSALLAPVAETMRLLRQRGLAPSIAAACLLAVALAQCALVAVPTLPGGLVALGGLQVLALLCRAHLDGALTRRGLLGVAATAPAVLLALAAPALAARGLRVVDVVSAQEELWNAAAMPVALVVLLAGTAVAARPLRADEPSTGSARLVALSARALLLAAGAGAAGTLFLGPVAPVAAAGSVVLLVLAERLLPALRSEAVARWALRAAAPLALAQLLVVAVVSTR